MEVGTLALGYSPYIYVVMACLAVEAIALLFLWRWRGVGLRPIQTLAFLGAGASFATGLLVVAEDGPLALFGISLALAFAFHLWDIIQRWQ